MKHEDSLPCLQKRDTGPYSEPDESIFLCLDCPKWCKFESLFNISWEAGFSAAMSF
jgi:hypothetical protein